MKAFHFRLEPAVRWRETQLRLERESVSRAAAKVAKIQNDIIATYTALRSGSSELMNAGTAAFHSWSSYVDRCNRNIAQLQEQLSHARKALVAATEQMVEAHQNLKVLENLKHDDHAKWERDLNRETEAFADEAFLARLQARQATIERRTGA